MSDHTYVRLPGLADVHVHLREPGGEHKEDVRSGTTAALAGGFTTVLAMPNTDPPLVTLSAYRAAQRRADAQALCDVYHFAGASADHVGELPALGREAVGLKVYLDQTYGPLRLAGLTTLMACFRAWPKDKVIAFHAEGSGVAIAIGLAAAFDQRIHLCHVSRKSEIGLIAEAKRRGLPVTCEVTPHHLFLTERDLPRLGTFGEMKPRLASPSDVEALWAHIDTVIDCVATDHAPHTIAEKESDDAPPGVPGLDTALPLMLTAVAEGRLTLERVVELMATNPRRIFKLPKQPDTWIEVDTEDDYILSQQGLHSKCGWSPFLGTRLRGRVHRVQFRGRPVVRNGEIRAPFVR